MAKDNNQGKQQKPQSDRSGKITINESTHDSGSAGGFERSRKGTAGDGTNNTGPRKKEE